MRRKITAGIICIMLGVSLLSGCKKGNSSSSEDAASSASLRLLNGKSEVDSQIQQLAAAYTQQTGVNVEVESLESGVDGQAKLKGYYLSDTMPDIFFCEAANFSNWDGLLVDMSDQPWVSRTDAAYVDAKYGTLGFPYTTEAIGFIYNADILKKAGVDPAKLTTPQAYRDAFETIDAKKGQLGLTAVAGYGCDTENIGWSTGNHLFGVYLDSGLARDDTTYIDLLNDGGKYDDSRFSDYADFVGLISEYADPVLKDSGTYDEQVGNFVDGKYAFMTQGSWTGALMSDISFEVGMAPYAFEDGMDTILTSSPSWWVVIKEGNVDEAEAFLEWCSGDAGQKILVEDAGFISPFTDCNYIANDPFAPVVSKYISDGKTSSWHWGNMKAGLNDVLAPLYDDYANGKLDKNGFIDKMKKDTAAYYAK